MTARASRRRQPGPRGYGGRGGGNATYVQPVPMWRGTSMQVCGLWPFVRGAGSPNIGVPLGKHLETGERVSGDPISWFMRARLISNPSMWVEAIPGVGKTTLVAKIAVGLAGFGYTPVVLGDIRPDYIEMVRRLDGQVIRLGDGLGHLNPLDMGLAPAAAERLSGDARQEVLADAHARRKLRVETIVRLSRGVAPSDRERSLLSRALTILDDRHPGVPVLGDLLEVIRDAPSELRAIALDRGDLKRYQEITEDLEATLVGLASGARFGDMFSAQTDEPMAMDRAVCFDVSQLRTADEDTQAAALMMCWSVGYGNIAAAQILADEGLIARRQYLVITDEVHRVLRAGGGSMVETMDQATRLNRTDGTGNIQATHTMSDLQSLPNEEDRHKAIGFVERAGMLACGGLPAREMQLLSEVVSLSRREQDMLTQWSAAGAWNVELGREEPPPGRGKFLLKVGRRPGIPVQVALTDSEQALSMSNARWTDSRPQEDA